MTPNPVSGTIQIDPLAALKVASLERDTLRNALLIAEHRNVILQGEVDRITAELERLQDSSAMPEGE